MTALTTRLAKLDSTRTGILLICVVGFFWALMEVVTAYAAAHYSLYQVVWVRYATHLIFMVLVLGPRLGRKLFATQKLGLQLVRAVMMLIMPVSFILAVEHLSVGNILSLFWLAPFMIIVFSMWLTKESAPWWTWLIALIGLCCVWVLTRPNAQFTVNGVLLALAMGASFSLYAVMTRMLRHESTITNLFYTAAGVLVPLSVGMPWFWKPLTLQGGVLMALVGLLGFALLWVLDKALEMASAAIVAPFFYSEIFFMLVLRLILRIF
jgi:drug/metabolite transporter (DMT)-like permease